MSEEITPLDKILFVVDMTIHDEIEKLDLSKDEKNALATLVYDNLDLLQ